MFHPQVQARLLCLVVLQYLHHRIHHLFRARRLRPHLPLRLLRLHQQGALARQLLAHHLRQLLAHHLRQLLAHHLRQLLAHHLRQRQRQRRALAHHLRRAPLHVFKTLPMHCLQVKTHHRMDGVGKSSL